MSSLFRFSVLGIVQGLTEFLPVSSSGHLAILSDLFKLSEVSVEFTLLLHLATLCAVILYLRREILHAIKSPRVILILAAATIPTGIIGILLKNTVRSVFQGGLHWVFIFLFITGVIVFFVGRKKSGGIESLEKMTYLKVFIIGIAQGIAVLPGISRSGATIAAGVFCGFDTKTAAKFSFLLSIPAILGAAVVGLKDVNVSSLMLYPISHIFTGMLLAFFSALFGLWILVKIVDGNKFRFFAYYLWGVALFGIITTL